MKTPKSSNDCIKCDYVGGEKPTQTPHGTGALNTAKSGQNGDWGIRVCFCLFRWECVDRNIKCPVYWRVREWSFPRLYLSVWLCLAIISLSVYLPLYLSVSLAINISTCLSSINIFQSIYNSIYLSICLSI